MMRFFPELGLCFGDAFVSPAVDTVDSQPHEPVQFASEMAFTARRRLVKRNSTKLWKPALSVIAEDGDAVVSGEHRTNGLMRLGSANKSDAKAKSSGKSRSHNYGDDYRKSCHRIALPAFSPMPFLF